MTNSAASDRKIWTVTEVNALLRDILENSFTSMWLSGEIGNLTLHRSGHVYLTLKDADAQIRAVFFGGTTQFRQWNLKEGDRLEAYGNLSVYAARGEYQFNIRMIRPCGIGELQ
jgi:exodeoxyribonuclease VII large subunit